MQMMRCPTQHAEVCSPSSAQVLLPALRDDMARLPLPADVAGSPDAPLTNGVAATDQHDGADAAQTHGQCSASGLAAAISAQQDGHDTNGIPAERRRRYLTCCVRLSPEKEPHRFVELVEILARHAATPSVTCYTLEASVGRRQPQLRTVGEHTRSARRSDCVVAGVESQIQGSQRHMRERHAAMLTTSSCSCIFGAGHNHETDARAQQHFCEYYRYRLTALRIL